MVVRWSRRASLECLRTKAELTAKAIRRIRVTAARPWLGTGSRSPEAIVCLGRCRQAWRNPCLKAQCSVRSIQPLFSFFQRPCPTSKKRMGISQMRISLYLVDLLEGYVKALPLGFDGATRTLVAA